MPLGAYGLKLTKLNLQLGEDKLEDEEEVGAEHHLLNAPASPDDLAALGGSVEQLTVQVKSAATLTCSALDCQALPEIWCTAICLQLQCRHVGQCH